MFILPLANIGSDDVNHVGGKAFHLGELVRAGMNVPPGFALTTDAFRAFISANRLQSELDALIAHADPNSAEFKRQVASFRVRLIEQSLPNEIMSALGEALGDSNHAYAVRSSALAEDLAQTSFAGQYDTFLNRRGLDEVLDAVKRCWASAWNERALVYLHNNGLSREHHAMGVIVQRQIPAQVSGVLFTLNPLNGRENEMMIEATWGLGEAVVSGHVTPDHFVVDWLERKILSSQIADKSIKIIPGERGTQEVETPAAERTAPTLSDTQILALAELGEEVMAFYGAPQDIEWAIADISDFAADPAGQDRLDAAESPFGQISDPVESTPLLNYRTDKLSTFVLQSRPLTAIHFTIDEGVWTGANIREVMPGVVTPLSFSTSIQGDFVRTSNEFLVRVGIAKASEMIFDARTVFGHAYWRVDRLKERIMSLPGMKERGLDESVGIEPAYAGDGRVTPYNLATLMRGLPVLLKIGRVYDTFWKENEHFRQVFDEQERAFRAVNLAETSVAELDDYIHRLVHFHYQTNYYGMTTAYIAVQAQDDFRPLLESLNQTLPRDEEPIALANLMNVKQLVGTARPVLRMWKLARAALANVQVAKVIRETTVEELSTRLQSFDEGRTFWKEFADYIADLYYMSDTDEDFARPRYDEDPALALTTLKQIVVSGNLGDPAAHILELHNQRTKEEARVTKHLSRGLMNSLFRKSQFLKQMEILQTYTYWREETRVLVARAHYLCHRYFAELGRRWQESGFIENAGDVFELERDQVFDALEGGLSSEQARAAITRAKRIRAAFRNFHAPWTLSQEGASRRQADKTDEHATKFVGVGCGAGRACGRVRVITDLGEAGKLQKGEILVAPYTNPGWTPLFTLAAGIVMEEGGLLSHGAVVAREVGVPAVLQIKHATNIFRDGQRVCVDGSRGTVELIA